MRAGTIRRACAWLPVTVAVHAWAVRRRRSLGTRDLTTSMQTERVTTAPVAMVNDK